MNAAHRVSILITVRFSFHLSVTSKDLHKSRYERSAPQRYLHFPLSVRSRPCYFVIWVKKLSISVGRRIGFPNFIKLISFLTVKLELDTALSANWAACNLGVKHLLVFKNCEHGLNSNSITRCCGQDVTSFAYIVLQNWITYFCWLETLLTSKHG